jgi:hypothetical protein
MFANIFTNNNKKLPLILVFKEIWERIFVFFLLIKNISENFFLLLISNFYEMLGTKILSLYKTLYQIYF